MPESSLFALLTAVSGSDQYKWLRGFIEHAGTILGLVVAGALMWTTLQFTVAENTEDIAKNNAVDVRQDEAIKQFREIQVEVTTTLEHIQAEQQEIKREFGHDLDQIRLLLERARDRELGLRRPLP